MDFGMSERCEGLREELLTFMDEHVYRAEKANLAEIAASDDPYSSTSVLRALKEIAKEKGLWNLFLPDDEWGPGLSNVDYAPLAEIMGRSAEIAPEATNCAAPDTGNMEVLTTFGSHDQQQQWLVPLLAGEIRSAFSMTEPRVASSDPRNLETSIVADGEDFVVNGRKWWITGASSKECKISIVMGVTNPDAPPKQRFSMILVPMDTPGTIVERDLPVFGFHERGGHSQIAYNNVRVPAANIIGEPGSGYQIAQARLGPGRIHHCMRVIGMAERALDMMKKRVKLRKAFGGPLADNAVIQEWIAESRMRIDQARLLVMHAAWKIDTMGSRAARVDVSAIKVVAPNSALWVIDKAIQAHGGAGIGDDFGLSRMYAFARTLRIADGPDEVHRMVVARAELR
ncbi:Acyl-CoA dehydrogenase [hydrothermal vent metagenome]|uniref:Acyl-CoA dehydrogenase n=1 Tax=hydrothermal vent metagenome TaxID=652676 RepID=A0A3B0SB57_9ZZZZ